MQKNSTFFTFIAVLLLSITSCQKGQQEDKSFVYESTESNNSQFASFVNRESVAPPFQGVDVPFETFSLNADAEHIFELDNGTTIEVPADIFVDAEGNPVKGNIELHYREFHDATAVLASGIPMTSFNEAGDLESFLQTAGMIEMQATDANNKAVFIKKGAAINVEMASHIDGKGYDFLELDGKTGAWANLGTNEAVPNPKRIALQKELNKLTVTAPSKPVKLDKTKPVLDFDINLDAYPNLRSMNGLVWQYNGNDPAKNPIQQTWVLQHEWETADIQASNKKGVFKLTLKGGDKTFETTICPSLKEADYQKALATYNSNLEGYKKNMLTADSKREMVNQQAAFRRAFQVTGMGIYNCDRILQGEDYLMVNAKYELDINIPNFERYMKLYHITADGRSVIPYQGKSVKKLIMNTEQDNKLVAVLPNGKVGTFSQDNFDEQMDNIRQGNFTFKLKVQDKKINSIEDLKMLLNEIG